jgi:hypothetical protein
MQDFFKGGHGEEFTACGTEEVDLQRRFGCELEVFEGGEDGEGHGEGVGAEEEEEPAVFFEFALCGAALGGGR